MADFERRYEDLTVDHGNAVRHYRLGNALAARQDSGEASAEDLRGAMIHYKALVDELRKGEPPGATRACLFGSICAGAKSPVAG